MNDNTTKPRSREKGRDRDLKIRASWGLEREKEGSLALNCKKKAFLRKPSTIEIEEKFRSALCFQWLSLRERCELCSILCLSVLLSTKIL